MAIVKASYTRSRAKIKAALRYIVHRPGREGERLTRTLFSGEKTLSKADAYRLIDETRGMTFFHLKINFHPTWEDTRKDLDLPAITRQTIATLQERFNRPIRYFAVEHNDHTDLRHIHAIVLMKLSRGERIGRQDWQACREEASAQALLERRSLDAVRRYQKTLQRNLSKSRQGMMQDRAVSRFAGVEGGWTLRGGFRGVRQQTRLCPECNYRNTMVRLPDGNAYYCPTCRNVEEIRPRLRLHQEQELRL
jgi:hypothetical protein